jgi:hypothetical protein
MVKRENRKNVPRIPWATAGQRSEKRSRRDNRIFLVRMPVALYQLAREEATHRNLSLHDFIVGAVQTAVQTR